MRLKQKMAAMSMAGAVLTGFTVLQTAPAAAAFPAPPLRSAAAVTVPADSQTPTDSGLRYRPGQRLEIRATGKATYGPESQSGCTGTPVTTPDGKREINGVACAPKLDPDATLPTAPIGSLIASIGIPGNPHSSGWFYAGDMLGTRTFKYEGEIYLSYNDDPGSYGNNTGAYKAWLKLSYLF